MPRKKNDGRGKIEGSGRKAGTPNREKPLKTFLREHSLNYFTPNLTVDTIEDGKLAEVLRHRFGDNYFSQYDVDLLCMKASDRVKAEIDLIKFHTPQMQATSVDMSVQEQNASFADRLHRLADGEDIPSPSE